MARKRDKNERLPYEARRWADGIIDRHKLGNSASVNGVSEALDKEVESNKQSLASHGLFGKVIGEGYGLLESMAMKNRSVDLIHQRLQERKAAEEMQNFGSGQAD